MADVTTAPAATPDAATTKKSAKKEKKVTRPKASHPTTAVMVSNAIKNLKERGGSSLQAIKKYIAATYKVDTEKMAPFIKKYLKASVVAGSLVQTKGKGASGSFKLATQAVTKPTAKASTRSRKPAPKPTPKKTAVVKKPVAKKAAKPKRGAPKKVAAPKPAAAKSPVISRKTAKAPTKKPKSPKAKTTKATKAKKASPKKK